MNGTVVSQGIGALPLRPSQKPIAVLKFGGTTVGSTRSEGRIRQARNVIADFLERGYYVVPVFSAYRRGRSGSSDKVSITDELQGFRSRILSYPTLTTGLEAFRERLMEPHQELMNDLQVEGNRELIARVQEQIEQVVLMANVCCQASESIASLEANIITAGERLSTSIIAAYLNAKYEKGKFPMNAAAVSGLTAGLITDGNYLNAKIEWQKASTNVREILLGRYLDHGIVPVLSGFDGIYDPQDEYKGILNEDDPKNIEERYNNVYRTCLGRGGSDLTATFAGMALGAEFVGFVKETKGVLTCDDMLVGDSARTVKKLDYELATEAGNIYSRAIDPVKAAGIPVHIFNPADPSEYTEISGFQLPDGFFLVTHPEPSTGIHVGTVPDEPGGLIKLLQFFLTNDVNVAEVYHHRSGTDFIVSGTDENIEFAARELSDSGFQPQINPIWYVRVVGNLTPDLSERFNRLVHSLQATASTGYQFGARTVTATFHRNRVGSEGRERHRINQIVKTIHDELVADGVDILAGHQSDPIGEMTVAD